MQLEDTVESRALLHQHFITQTPRISQSNPSKHTMKLLLIFLGLLVLTSAKPQQIDEASGMESMEASGMESMEASGASSEELSGEEGLDVDEIEGSGGSEEISAEDNSNDYNEPTYECEEASDCPQYHFCFASAFLGTRCDTFMYKRNFTDCIYCKTFTDANDESTAMPAHDFCTEIDAEERGTEADESSHKCNQEAGYCCSTAYYNACDPQEEEACPTNMECVEQAYKDAESVFVCKPQEREFDYLNEIPCEKAYDCPWSELEASWSLCRNNVCQVVLEKPINMIFEWSLIFGFMITFLSLGVELSQENCVQRVVLTKVISFEYALKCIQVQVKYCSTIQKTVFQAKEIVQCEDSMHKACQIKYDIQPLSVSVEHCTPTPKIEACSESLKVLCSTKMETVCQKSTKPSAHNDIPNCSVVLEESCSNGKCFQIPKEMFTEVPHESCQLKKVKSCKNVHRSFPALKPVQTCITVPKEFCYNIRTLKEEGLAPTIQPLCPDIDSKNTILVFGGLFDKAGPQNGAIEVLNVKDLRHCPPLPKFPVPLRGSFGLPHQGQPLICGGFNSESGLLVKDCFFLDPVAWQWNQFEEATISRRAFPKVISLDGGDVLVMGGQHRADDPWELFTNGTFQPLAWTIPPNLEIEASCVVRWHERIFFMSSRNEYSSFTLDLPSKEWTIIEGIPHIDDAPRCAQVTILGQDYIAVLATGFSGFQAVRLDTMVWQTFQEVGDFSHGSVVGYQGQALILGGYLFDSNSFSKDIFLLDHNGRISLTNLTLTVPRAEFLAFLVPDNFCAGNWTEGDLQARNLS
eukprot:maker-scaffold42_size484952-snap-gene-1.12 protein:Tk06359 transcript:maker-scaffold42_size484952-snap-gene-1.12-mRNA-1 annotation:"hypothetical protein"